MLVHFPEIASSGINRLPMVLSLHLGLTWLHVDCGWRA
jgi:hypothetical protein